jgi:hypothetical protein
MSGGLDRLAGLLGRAALDVWGDMPREIQEALFETAMQGRQAEREELARLLHDHYPRARSLAGALKEPVSVSRRRPACPRSFL